MPTKPDDTPTKEQLEAAVKKANWEQARVVYTSEIKTLLLEAQLDELRKMVGALKLNTENIDVRGVIPAAENRIAQLEQLIREEK